MVTIRSLRQRIRTHFNLQSMELKQTNKKTQQQKNQPTNQPDKITSQLFSKTFMSCFSYIINKNDNVKKFMGSHYRISSPISSCYCCCLEQNFFGYTLGYPKFFGYLVSCTWPPKLGSVQVHFLESTLKKQIIKKNAILAPVQLSSCTSLHITGFLAGMLFIFLHWQHSEYLLIPKTQRSEISM